MNDKRADYWDNTYFDYWKSRVDEANEKGQEILNSKVVSKDYKVPSDTFIENILKNNILSKGKLLDVGCGWGRMFKFYNSLDCSIYGVDISNKMIDEAKSINDKYIREVRVSSAENMPFEDETFDYLLCLGVFDATFQHQALNEFFRVIKKGGTIIITGKNDNYLDDDKEAYLAEKGAARKGEPNYFTDYKYLAEQVKFQGHKIENEIFFVRRGDFGKGHYKTKMPAHFYEYFTFIKKITNQYNFKQLSAKISKTTERK